jgi:fused signal recognition particle receptor
MPWILLVLVLVVAVFGFAVLLFGRLRGGAGRLDGRPPSRTPTITTKPPVISPPRPGALAGSTRAPDRLVDHELGELTEQEMADLEAEALAAAPIDGDGSQSGEGAVGTELIERPRFRDRLGRVRSAFSGAFGSVRSRGGITVETWDELEEALLTADVGVGLTAELLDAVRLAVKTDRITDAEELLTRLKAEMLSRLSGVDTSLRFDGVAGHPDVWLFVGVNGVGKTTTIGKVASLQAADGRSVLMAAGDTFRAAAAEQLGMWADRAGAELVRGDEGADPAAIVFDGVERATARGIDLVLADTAGRLHTKSNLMEELRKVRRVAEKGAGVVTETLMVLDATTGQNGLVQARQFTEAVDVTGVVLTKLDGSAKGGIVLAIVHELGLAVKLVGLGEGIGDLTEFDPQEFVDALFS